MKKSPFYPFYESMSRYHDKESGTTLRVWRRVNGVPDGPDMELTEAVMNIPATAKIEDVLRTICNLDRITAVEITDANGHGVIKYLEW